MTIFAVDLDDTLCVRPKNVESLGTEKYTHCTPIISTITKVNSLYEEGHHIIIYTARGMSYFSGNVNLVYSNLYELTKKQLDVWGVKYHQLIMGKLHYDMLIDDKCMRPEELKKI
jgi:hypothetical protein